MTPAHRSLVFAVIVATAGLGAGAAFADDQCTSLDTVVHDFQNKGAVVYMIPTDRLQAVVQDTSLYTGGQLSGRDARLPGTSPGRRGARPRDRRLPARSHRPQPAAA